MLFQSNYGSKKDASTPALKVKAGELQRELGKPPNTETPASSTQNLTVNSSLVIENCFRHTAEASVFPAMWH